MKTSRVLSGDMELPSELRRADRSCDLDLGPRRRHALEHQHGAVLAVTQLATTTLLGPARGVQNGDRDLVEPVDGALPRQLHLDVACAQRRLLLGALLQLKRAEDGDR